MRPSTIVPVLSLVLILSGCGPVESQNPLFTDKDVTFDPGLIGTWVSHEPGEPDVVTFKRGRGPTYKAIYRGSPKEEPFALEARLGQLEGLRFLDVTFVSGKGRGTHMFFRIWRDGNALQLAGLDSDWMGKMLTAGNVKLDYQRVEKEILLTAPTDELRRFIVRYAPEKEAFPDVLKLHRQP